MELSSYVALSGQLSLEKRMETLASNIANANTPGFKAGLVDFKTLLSQTGRASTAFVNTGANVLDMSGGGFTQTGNPLDLAVNGEAAFAYQSLNGTYYSRDGRLSLSPDGRLQNLEGHVLLDPSSAPVILDPNAGEVIVGRDGRLLQGGNVVGQVGLFVIESSSGFSRRGSSGFVPKETPQPVVDFSSTGITQGFVEGSNVNSVMEMVNLIKVSRAFEAASTFADKAMEAERNAIETIGGRG
jgi:flagellar basal-body rod protein FlgF